MSAQPPGTRAQILVIITEAGERRPSAAEILARGIFAYPQVVYNELNQLVNGAVPLLEREKDAEQVWRYWMRPGAQIPEYLQPDMKLAREMLKTRPLPVHPLSRRRKTKPWPAVARMEDASLPSVRSVLREGVGVGVVTGGPVGALTVGPQVATVAERARELTEATLDQMTREHTKNPVCKQCGEPKAKGSDLCAECFTQLYKGRVERITTYRLVIADLYAQKLRIDEAIKALEAVLAAGDVR